jgi:signal transduction histidine kinase
VFSALWVIPIAWMAVRYERLMAALVAAVMAATAFLAFTLPGMPTEPNNLLSLQASLVATGLIGTLVSASLAGRRQAIAGLEREEDRLRRSEALLADAASIGGIGSWEVDPGSGDATWSDELYRITGIAAGTPVRADSLPSLLEPGDAERLRADVAGAGQETALSLRLEALDGGTRAVVIAWRRQTDADGRPRIVGVVRDVTEEQALQEQLLQAQRVESIGMLAGGVAHDFNNLLTAIAGFTEFARLSVEAGESPDTDLAQVQAAVERARSLTGQLLAYGRRAIVHPRPVDLGAAVEAMSPMLGRLLGEHIEVRTERGERAVAVLDPGQLDQVLVNLAVNARDAMPSGGHLRIATGRTGTASGTAWLEVQDDGVGMDPDVVERIFLPFFTTKERGRGTGLGLSTVYGIVTQAGGTIRVTSQPDAGSTFRVDLTSLLGLRASSTWRTRSWSVALASGRWRGPASRCPRPRRLRRRDNWLIGSGPISSLRMSSCLAASTGSRWRRGCATAGHRCRSCSSRATRSASPPTGRRCWPSRLSRISWPGQSPRSSGPRRRQTWA